MTNPMTRRFQFSLRTFDRKIGPVAHVLAGGVVGFVISAAFMLGRDGRSLNEWWPCILAGVLFGGVLFLVASLLEPFIERRD
jgi:hypothetical protein